MEKCCEEIVERTERAAAYIDKKSWSVAKKALLLLVLDVIWIALMGFRIGQMFP